MATEKRKRGRPATGRTTHNVNTTLTLDVIEWLKELGGGSESRAMREIVNEKYERVKLERKSRPKRLKS